VCFDKMAATCGLYLATTVPLVMVGVSLPWLTGHAGDRTVVPEA
jgi:hypothetical protein